MKTSKIKTIGLSLLAAGMGMAASAGGTAVAVLQGPNGRHNAELNAGLNELALEFDCIPCTAAGMKAFTEQIDKYSLAMAVPLFNWAGKTGATMLKNEEVDFAAIRKWLEKGGVLVVTDANYTQQFDFLQQIDPRLRTGFTNCTSSPWTVRGFTSSVEPVHPARCFPNKVGEGDTWQHYADFPEGWKPLVNCSEGKPVMLEHAIGKGSVIVTVLRQPNRRNIENFRAYSMLKQQGLSVCSFSMTEVGVGDGKVHVDFSEPVPEGTTLTLEVDGGARNQQVFTTNVTGKAADLAYDIGVRGQADVVLSMAGKEGKTQLFRRSLELPPLFRVKGNAYRGTISTARRFDTVDFKLELAPRHEDLTSAKIHFSVLDSLGNEVCASDHELPASNLTSSVWLPVPIKRTLKPGEYTINGTLSKGRISGTGSATFEIVEARAAQTMVDEDNTFLVGHRPFFPLGIYHPTREYERVSELGFNTIQFWKWDTADDDMGVPRGLMRASACGLKCIVEFNHRGDQVLRDTANAYAHLPSIFAWYVFDEPDESAEAEAARINKTLHFYDKHHPTFLASCRPDAFPRHQLFCDIFAYDPYAGDDPKSCVEKAIAWTRQAEAATEGHKALIMVPWSTPKPETLRPTAYAGIVHGVRGIVWYPWNQRGGGPVGIGLHTNEPCQAAFKELLAELKGLMPGILSPNRRRFEEGDIHCLYGDGGRGQHYLIMLNASEKEVTADFAVPELDRVGGVALPIAPLVERKDKDGNVVTDKDGKPVMDRPGKKLEKSGFVKDTFKPFETIVYRW